MTKMVLIPAKDTEPVKLVEASNIQDIYRLIECDTFDLVVTPKACFYVDDNGMIVDTPRPNYRATGLIMNYFNRPTQVFYGNILMCGVMSEDGEDQDVSEETLNDLRRLTWIA